ncbi:MAG: SET domain-containing protein-lysine N-methyltransferase [Leptospiraceae bacterium]|nr:SET domain-containing protein-lysine N-methyltransferase [Leptospiraceae bacterium]
MKETKSKTTQKKSKKKPATKPKRNSAKKKSPAGKKKPAGSKPAGKKSPRPGSKKSSGAKKPGKPAAKKRPRILPADTPFPVQFSRKSDSAIEKFVYNKKSAIHGMGAFAKSRIPAKTYVGSYEGIPTLDDDIYVLWVEQDNGSWRGIDGKNALRYLNHSSSPNVEWDANHLYSIRSIEVHEELTFHYGDEWEDVE